LSHRHHGNRTGDPFLSRPCPSQLSHRRLEPIAFYLLQ
jgi:hypothetical protein